MSYPTYAVSTELDAVNQILSSVGQAPVTTLDLQNPEVSIVLNTLREVNKTIQAEGWSFNTDFEATLARNSSNEIPINPSVSRVVVDQQLYPDYDITQRGNKLYDRKNQTFEFTQDLKGDITYMFDWDDLPEHAHQYIMIRAGRQLQDVILGSADLTKINITAEQEARAQFLEEETTKSEHNMLRGNPNHTGVFPTYRPSRAVVR